MEELDVKRQQRKWMNREVRRKVMERERYVRGSGVIRDGRNEGNYQRGEKHRKIGQRK